AAFGNRPAKDMRKRAEHEAGGGARRLLQGKHAVRSHPAKDGASTLALEHPLRQAARRLEGEEPEARHREGGKGVLHLVQWPQRAQDTVAYAVPTPRQRRIKSAPGACVWAERCARF